MPYFMLIVTIVIVVLKSVLDIKNRSSHINRGDKFSQYFGQNFEDFTGRNSDSSANFFPNNSHENKAASLLFNVKTKTPDSTDNFTKHFGTDLQTLMKNASNGNTNNVVNKSPYIPTITGDSLTTVIDNRTEEAKNFGITIITAKNNVSGVNSRFTSMISFVLSAAVDVCKKNFLKRVTLELDDNGENISVIVNYPDDISDNTDNVKFIAEGMGGTFNTTTEGRNKKLEIIIPRNNAY